MPDETIVLSYKTLSHAIKDATEAKLEGYRADLLERLDIAMTSAIQTDSDPQFIEGLQTAFNMVKGGIIEPVYEAGDE